VTKSTTTFSFGRLTQPTKEHEPRPKRKGSCFGTSRSRVDSTRKSDESWETKARTPCLNTHSRLCSSRTRQKTPLHPPTHRNIPKLPKPPNKNLIQPIPSHFTPTPRDHSKHSKHTPEAGDPLQRPYPVKRRWLRNDSRSKSCLIEVMSTTTSFRTWVATSGLRSRRSRIGTAVAPGLNRRKALKLGLSAVVDARL
jgi:hypothetical protein